MDRIDSRTVHLTDEEAAAVRHFDWNLDKGQGIVEARDNARNEMTRRGIDLSEEFWEYLAS